MKEKITSTLSFTMGKVVGYFLWSVCIYYAYKWFSWNFNLPAMTYLNTVAIYSAFDILLNTIANKFTNTLDEQSRVWYNKYSK